MYHIDQEFTRNFKSVLSFYILCHILHIFFCFPFSTASVTLEWMSCSLHITSQIHPFHELSLEDPRIRCFSLY